MWIEPCDRWNTYCFTEIADEEIDAVGVIALVVCLVLERPLFRERITVWLVEPKVLQHVEMSLTAPDNRCPTAHALVHFHDSAREAHVQALLFFELKWSR